IKSGTIEGETLNSIGNTYLDMGDARTALKYYRLSFASLQKAAGRHISGGLYWMYNENSNIGNAYETMGMPDSALYFEQRMYADKQFPADLRDELTGRLGNAYARKGDFKNALNFYR